MDVHSCLYCVVIKILGTLRLQGAQSAKSRKLPSLAMNFALCQVS